MQQLLDYLGVPVKTRCARVRGLPEGLDLRGSTPHAFRKTVVTAIDRAVSIDLAAELLGHASEEAAETHYVQPTKRVSSVTAEALERLASDGGEPTLSAVELDRGVDDVA